MNLDDIKQIFKDCELDGNKIILKSKLHEVIELVMKKYGYDILKEITAVDSGEGQTELIYHLYATEDEEDLFLSIIVNGAVETVTDLFKSAIADEREIYDLFGINFMGHDDLKRLYMPEDWKGYPLRKDYVQDDSRLAWNDNHNA